VTERELLADCLRRLNRSELAYLLTGSMASNFWGIPRTTHGLDFVIQLPPSAVPRLLEVFRGGFFLDEAAVRAAFKPPFQFNAIDERSALKVDFWLPKPEAFDRELFSRRKKVRIFGEPAWIATAEDVILHKLFWNRLTPSDRQLGDAAGVLAVQGETLDKNYLRRWAGEIGVAAELEKLLRGEIKPKHT
jgi:hypothetical protein